MKRKDVKIWFTDFWDNYPMEKNIYYRLLKLHCNVTVSKENPDIVFFSVFGNSNKEFGGKHIFVVGEACDPDQYEYDYCISYHYYLENCDDALRFNIFGPKYPYLNFLRTGGGMMWAGHQRVDRKFCNFIYSNATIGSGALLRQEFCKKLSEYKPVDCPGDVLRNMDPSCITPRYGDWQRGKLEFIKNYKFTIAFENETVSGYTTEKLWHPLRAGSVPIYWGNPEITREVNPDSIINCHDFDGDWDAVIDRIKEIDNDPELYLHMLRCKPVKKGYKYGYGELNKFLKRVISEL